MPAQLDGLEMAANEKKKQAQFTVTNTPLAQAGQRQPLPSIADVSQPVQQVTGNADRARRMQAQFDQPVTRGTPPRHRCWCWCWWTGCRRQRGKPTFGAGWVVAAKGKRTCTAQQPKTGDREWRIQPKAE